ncbi:hypothetical protein BDP27DRAFT_1419797 [Rhodocollybia butyracea]|uniref:GLTSCR protein conserved domain-containing protein n=1 Tax=Rhodocollybia butyracea TaxID=206335 RepID=A0A9P5PYM8_9AGAR|nr:hypothetical protein BDP27DRAFT_1419797 [Rhodocollybia butyracea]
MSTNSFFSLSSSSVSAQNSLNQNNSSSFTFSAPPHIPASSSGAGPSTWRPPSHWNVDTNANPAASTTKPLRKKNKTLEENAVIEEISARVTSRIAADHAAVLNPDLETPFVDVIDAVNRLLPYHVFLQPKEDLKPLLADRKGKTKAVDPQEIKETKFALECHRRRKKLQERFRKARVKPGEGSEFNPQLVILTQSELETERAEIAALNAELRVVRSEYDRLERQKRASSNLAPPALATPARPSYYAPPQSANGQSTYYRPFPYPYATSYGVPTTPVQTALPTSTPQNANPASIAPNPVPATPISYQAGSAIPVQLPITSMPTLTQLGIVPVPAAALPPGQPPPPAVLRGSTSNGNVLNLEINVSLLQPSK